MKYQLIILIDDNDNTLFLNKEIVQDYFNVNESLIKSYNNPSKFLNDFSILKTEHGGKWLVFLDINMPEFNGYKLLEHMEEYDFDLNNIYIIMLTSSNQKIDIEKSEIYANIKAFWNKPITEDKLVEHFPIS